MTCLYKALQAQKTRGGTLAGCLWPDPNAGPDPRGWGHVVLVNREDGGRCWLYCGVRDVLLWFSESDTQAGPYKLNDSGRCGYEPVTEIILQMQNR